MCVRVHVFTYGFLKCENIFEDQLLELEFDASLGRLLENERIEVTDYNAACKMRLGYGLKVVRVEDNLRIEANQVQRLLIGLHEVLDRQQQLLRLACELQILEQMKEIRPK